MFIFFNNCLAQKLTMLRFPDSNTCYLLPLAKEQPIPEKLIKDLEKAEQVRACILVKTSL